MPGRKKSAAANLFININEKKKCNLSNLKKKKKNIARYLIINQKNK